ncbi:MAG: HyaD/HybD family hydrogenase maturation endopeptidase [Thermodesulfobacteriota bacterium]
MNKKISLIGLGNILMRDEGVGVQAVRALEKGWELPPELEVVDGGTSGLDLLPYIEGRDRVLFVDAVNFHQEPGYIGVLENREIPALFATKDSLHHLGLMDVLATAQLLDVLPREVCLIGIQPLSLETGLELSPLLQGKMELLLHRIIAKLQEWGLVCVPRRSQSVQQ